MQTTATNENVGNLVNRLKSGHLIPRPEFQRRLVWQNKDKINFLDTVLNGYPFPEIYLAVGDTDLEAGEVINILVDGQQRITTLAQYMSGSEELDLLNKITPYADLPREEKEKFIQYKVVVRDLGILSRAEIIEVFRRINSTSYSLNPMEIQNALYEGEFKSLAEDLAQAQIFEEYRFFSSAEVRRMRDINFILSLLSTIKGGYFHRDSKIEDMLKEYNDYLPNKTELSSNFKKVLNFIDDLDLDSSSRAWTKADFFTLFIELYQAIIVDGQVFDTDKLRHNLERFYSSISSESNIPSGDPELLNYYRAAAKSNTDRMNRITRADILRKRVFQDSLI